MNVSQQDPKMLLSHLVWHLNDHYWWTPERVLYNPSIVHSKDVIQKSVWCIWNRFKNMKCIRVCNRYTDSGFQICVVAVMEHIKQICVHRLISHMVGFVYKVESGRSGSLLSSCVCWRYLLSLSRINLYLNVLARLYRLSNYNRSMRHP